MCVWKLNFFLKFSVITSSKDQHLPIIKYKKEKYVLQSLCQEEALLDIIIGGVGGVDVFNPRETPADSAILIYSLRKTVKYTLSKLEHTGWLMYSDSSIQSSTLKAGQEIQCTSEKLFHDFFVCVYMVAHTKLIAILTGSLYQFHSPVSKGLNLPVPTSLQSQHMQSVP